MGKEVQRVTGHLLMPPWMKGGMFGKSMFAGSDPAPAAAAPAAATMPDPDGEAVAAARRRKIVQMQNRGGRESTFLSEDRLGG